MVFLFLYGRTGDMIDGLTAAIDAADQTRAENGLHFQFTYDILIECLDEGETCLLDSIFGHAVGERDTSRLRRRNGGL